MHGLRGLHVDAIEGDRWELALVLLETVEGQVQAGCVSLGRHTSGPAADGRIHIEVACSTDPGFLTATMAATELQQGLAQVEAMAASDTRFANLIHRCGVVREYVWDYGMGKTLLASVRDDDTVDWVWEPAARA